MKNLLLPFCLLLLLQMTLIGQSQPDTLEMRKKNQIIYQGQLIKGIKPLGVIILQEPVDLQLQKYWKQYKTTNTIGTGFQIAGIGLMGIDLLQTAQGEEDKTLLLTGAGILLTGAIVNAVVGNQKRKQVVRYYNDLKLGRVKQAFTQADLVVDTMSGKEKQPVSVKAAPEKHQQTQPTLPTNTDAYLSLSFGPGWSKQSINYAAALDEEYRSASVFSFGLQYGKPFSEQLDWQVGIGLTPHGYREEQITTTSGVRVTAKADVQISYLEIPLSIVYHLPIGNSGMELAGMPGLSIGYALSGKVVAHGKGENGIRTVRTKVTDKIALDEVNFADRLDAALLLGAQVLYPLDFGKVFLEARYHFGILNLERAAQSGDKAFNRTMLLRLGFRYAL